MTTTLVEQTRTLNESLDQLTDEINEAHEAAESAMRDSLAHAQRAGELLIKLKDSLAHGQFMHWVEQYCTFSHRMANYYMAVARAVPDSQSVANLTIVEASKVLGVLAERTMGSDELKQECEALKAKAKARLLPRWRARLHGLWFALGSPENDLLKSVLDSGDEELMLAVRYEMAEAITGLVGAYQQLEQRLGLKPDRTETLSRRVTT